MNRFMGMMPSEEVKLEGTLVDDTGSKYTVQAGENGWTILFPDHSSQYMDIVDTVENNYEMALKTLKVQFRTVTECNEDKEPEDERGEI